MRVLFIATHRAGRNPSQRFRFEQYMEWLQRQGWHCELSHLVEASDDVFLYKPGHFAQKIRFVARCIGKRRRDLRRAKDFDIVFISREALMTRSTFFERGLRKRGVHVVFDFDDSVWLSNVSDANRRWKWVKDPGKTSRIIALSDMVFAGNAYLSDYARQFNGNVRIVPTTIDADEYTPRPADKRDAANAERPVCIGWSGSITTIQHFQYAVPALRAIRERFGERVTFRVIGDGNFRMPELGIEGMPWRKDTELDDLRAIDIGMMPLPDDEWARGKCGLKGLQYMALGIPTLMSPVGVNTEIIRDGVDGYLPRTPEEWVERLARLVEDADLRRRMGEEARRTVVDRYSTKAWRDRYLQHFSELIATQQPQG